MPLSTDVVLSSAGRVDMRAATRLSCPEISRPEGRIIVKSSSLEAEKSSAGGALLPLLVGRDSVRCRDDGGSGLRLTRLGLVSRLGGAAVLARFLLALVVGAGAFDGPVPLGEFPDGVPLAGVSGLRRRLEAYGSAVCGLWISGLRGLRTGPDMRELPFEVEDSTDTFDAVDVTLFSGRSFEGPLL